MTEKQDFEEKQPLRFSELKESGGQFFGVKLNSRFLFAKMMIRGPNDKPVITHHVDNRQ